MPPLLRQLRCLSENLSTRLESDSTGRRHAGPTRLLQKAMARGLSDELSFGALLNALKIRNEALHLGRHVTDREAREAIEAIETALRRLPG